MNHINRPEHCEIKKKKLMPLWLMIPLDVIACGTCLIIFALFHHVLNFEPVEPTAYSNIPEKTETTAAPTSEYISESTPAPETEQVETTPEPTPEINYGQFGEKFKDKFTTDGEIISTESLYVSENIRIELSEDFQYNSKIHITDIYVKNITNLRTGFASGEGVFDGARMNVFEQSEMYGAQAAINGDFSGFAEYGDYCVLRNGVFFQNNPTRAVCVLYYDGTVKCFWERYNQTGTEFDIDEALEEGAWQIWSFGPSLLDENGEPNAVDYDTSVLNPRTLFGYYETGHYCFITIEGRTDESYGVNFVQEAEYAKSLGLKQAFNLDGGGSSTMTFNGELISIGSPNDPLRPVTDIIYVVDGEYGLTRGDME